MLADSCVNYFLNSRQDKHLPNLRAIIHELNACSQSNRVEARLHAIRTHLVLEDNIRSNSAVAGTLA
jgi:hypothetical protein